MSRTRYHCPNPDHRHTLTVNDKPWRGVPAGWALITGQDSYPGVIMIDVRHGGWDFSVLNVTTGVATVYPVYERVDFDAMGIGEMIKPEEEPDEPITVASPSPAQNQCSH